ncbi:TPA_exp: Uncharacterized protein A8136_3687 [Trichophyton benhamiae CBS 112371]|uniref:BBC1/AIM3 cysteine proteinase-fold domain-containing protein n=1 Tax=Arthroderma benhamiae (strain ATCC MYA-4681 / CBS 112371) TaxID=663331 RepID=D4B168_ARTBC|nr:uncharacterized protein ARB_02197 [Trichophyton benhamiae CBS 112371]EFE31003.1 hypothetical protein ARB_02197 [Trichophyton benhamiae CBS 112371]DAA74189.1 TPA_exp: Uncharacterized protein A8136_3687 [Trichophyton benhamiae CBS 112371]
MSRFKNESAIPLSLETLWFTHSPPTFPYPALRQLGTILNANYAWESTPSLTPGIGTEHIFIGAVAWAEDSASPTHPPGPSGIITKIRVRWFSTSPSSATAEVKNIFPTTTTTHSARQEVTDTDLQLASDWYAPNILAYVKSHVGLTIGDGECWTLAYKALQHAGQKALREGREPPMLSTGRVHGCLIFEWTACAEYPITYSSGILGHVPTGIRAGDILELNDGRFRTRYTALAGLGLVGTQHEENVRFSAHTAVIVAVKMEDSTLGVVEQNGRARCVVAENEYNLSNMVSGVVRIYRPIGVSLVMGSNLHDVSLVGVCDEW